VAVVAPVEVSYTGTSGAPSVQYRAGFTGTLTARPVGLVASTVTTHAIQGTNPEFDPFDPVTGPGVATTTVQVPTGTKVVQWSTRASEQAAGVDVDLYLYDPAGNVVTFSEHDGSDETVTLTAPAAGAYRVYIVQYAAPPGAPNQTIRLHRHLVGSGPGNLTATPTNRSVTAGLTYTVTLGWSGLATGTRYLGLLEYLQGSTVIGQTIVRVRT